MPPITNTDHLTDDEREAVEELAAETATDTPDTGDEAEAEDRPWLNDARAEMRQFLTDEELAAMSDDDEEGDEDPDAEDGEAQAQPEQAEPAEPAAEEPEPAPKAPLGQDLTQEEVNVIRAQTKQKLRELKNQHDNGEKTDAEWEADQELILDGEVEAMNAAREAKLDAASQAMYEQRVEQHRAAAKAFFQANPVLQAPEHAKRFDELQQLVQSDPKYRDKSSVAIFDRAKAMLAAEAREENREIPGLTQPPKRPTHATTKTIPPTLANVPVAAVNQPEGSDLARKAAEIDNADALQAEKLMARLTPDEQDRILQGDY